MRKAQRLKSLAVLIVLLSGWAAKSQTPAAIIDSLSKQTNDRLPVDEYIRNCFTIADNFMEIDQYDSAQLWLNSKEVQPCRFC